jgi:hypothetical protein
MHISGNAKKRIGGECRLHLLQYLLNLRQVPFIFVGVRVSLAGDQLANAMIGSGLPPPFRHIIST